MGAIQQNVNSAINTAGIIAGLYTQTPGFKLKKQLEGLDQQKEIIGQKLEAQKAAQEVRKRRGLKPTEGETQILNETGEHLEGVLKQQFELNPTEENYKFYKTQKNVNIRSNNIQKEQQDLAAKAQETQQRLEEQQTLQAAQKEALNNRLKFLRERVGNKNLTPEEQSKALQQLIEERKKGGIK